MRTYLKWFYELSYLLWSGRVIVLVIASATLIPSEAMATFSTTMHRFSMTNSTTTPLNSGLTMGSDGNLYGVHSSDGVNALYGSVFKITPSGVYTVLHSFSSADPAGSNPYGTLLLGNDGNMYGATNSSIFRITPNGTLSIVVGNTTSEGIVQGIDGSFYSTVRVGSAATGYHAEIFKVSPSGVVSSLHVFSNHSDGCGYALPLIRGNDGNFYGVMSDCGLPDTTLGGGLPQTNGKGTIYQITPNGVFAKLYTFLGGTDGSNPSSSLVQGSDGNFYGTTSGFNAVGGLVTGRGTVFKITSTGIFTTIYTFPASSTAAGSPTSPLTQASDGNFYGATSTGIYKITPSGAFTSIYTFQSSSSSGNIVVSGDLKSIYGLMNFGLAIYRVSIGTSSGADLSISSVSGSETTSGVSTFNLNVSNAGPEAATGATVSFGLPNGTTLVSNSGTCQVSSANSWACSVGTLAAGSAVSFTATSQSTPAAVISTPFTVGSDVSDPNLNDNVVGITVSPQINSLSINGSTNTQIPSGLQHNLKITNAGPGIATHVAVSASLPVGATLVASASSSGCLQVGQQLTCSMGSINVGASLQLVVTILNDFNPIIFTVTADQTNLNAANSYQDYPPGYDVPTLPQWGAILMGLFLMFISVTQSRRRT